MQFNSLAFLIFLPLVVGLYYLLPHRYRWILLLASYFFYGYWKIEYLSLMIISTLLDYFVSNALYKYESPTLRKGLLWISCAGNLGMLFLFKYLGLFVDPIDLTTYNMNLDINSWMKQGAHFLFFALPVGISFYTFQTMSYTIDVYYRKSVPAKSLGKFALFVSFFPQLVAGPIERFNHLMPQLTANHSWKYENFSQSFRLLLYGFFIKMCIADQVAPLVNEIYASPQTYNRLNIGLGLLLFGVQIYADFSGYSLIAIGAAKMLGIQLMDNFRTPYLSSSIHEFWQRWHISLSTWFRDYLYIPLGGNRKGKARWILNIMLVFSLSGFWHGASWTFMIWGGIHGLTYLLEFGIKRTKIWSLIPSFLKKGLGILLTFAIVHVAWVFFRAGSLEQVTIIFTNLFQQHGTQSLEIDAVVWLMLSIFILSDGYLLNTRIDTKLANWPIWLRWALYLGLLFCILAFGGVANHPFIYFQF